MLKNSKNPGSLELTVIKGHWRARSNHAVKRYEMKRHEKELDIPVKTIELCRNTS